MRFTNSFEILYKSANNAFIQWSDRSTISDDSQEVLVHDTHLHLLHVQLTHHKEKFYMWWPYVYKGSDRTRVPVSKRRVFEIRSNIEPTL